ncbi:MAG TPA: nitroreductase family protein [bacterium]|nr:nitroreductase family protein [bacterium]HPN43862.1 nitroreductase family protein [bacterium]
MNRRTFVKTLPAAAVLGAALTGYAQELPLQPIPLPKPETEGGLSVLAALKERKTIRSISAVELPPQMLSNLLWAAFGVNRDKGPNSIAGRTAATASNAQEIDLYVALPAGIYLYEAVPHLLKPVVAGDFRYLSGRRRGAAADAPVNIIFVADISRYKEAPFQEPGLRDPVIQRSYYNIAAGMIAGNVYLFAASQGLAAWFHNCDKEGLTSALKLNQDQRVLYAQTVGFPAS